jgi:hypothetical protein
MALASPSAASAAAPPDVATGPATGGHAFSAKAKTPPPVAQMLAPTPRASHTKEALSGRLNPVSNRS